APIADDDLAGEREAPGIDLARPRRVGGAQILRRDEQPVGPGRGEAPADEGMRVQPRQGNHEGAARHEPGEPSTLRDQSAGHGLSFPSMGILSGILSPESGHHIANGPDAANSWALAWLTGRRATWIRCKQTP